MKMVKSLVLGSAAALVVMGGAQAADLPVKAKPVEYVKICSLYGAGFWYIPGTDTCLKLGGYLRVDVIANSNSDDTGNVSAQGGAKNRFTNGYTWRSREDFTIDTRTVTEYGVVRTFADIVFSWTTGSFAGNGNGSTAYEGNSANNASAGGVAAGTLGVYYAFIQFAGFTMGKAISQFSTPWTNYPANNFDGLVGGGGTVTGVNQFTYTWDLGNGMSVAVSAQDQVQYYQAGVINLSVGGFGASDYAGTIAPDFVGMFRIDQAWGLFQASFAAHDNHVAYYSPFGTIQPFSSEVNGHPDDKWGWAVQLAAQIKNIPTGPGDDVKFQGVYTDAATRYNIQDLASQFGAVQLYGNSGLGGPVYQSVTLNAAPDTVFVTGSNQHAVKTWGVQGGYNHNWTPNWSSGLYGAWAQVRFDGFSKDLLCGVTGVTGGPVRVSGAVGTFILAGGTCNPDYQIAQVGLITRWTPVKNLTFSADVTWQQIDTKFAGLTPLGASALFGKPNAGALYQLKSNENGLVMFRAQRNW